MEVSQGANLIGMSVFPVDVCPYSLLSKKKKKLLYFNYTLIPRA